jgi:DNA-binding transcriptional regulator GbsR (MarR family)
MNKETRNIYDDFTKSAGNLCVSFGVNRIIGQLYALLYISPRAMSLDDMAGCLRVSKATVSMNVRTLENWGAVKKVWVRNSRKDFYEANLDTVGVIIERLKLMLQRRLEDIAGTMEDLDLKVKAGASQDSDDILNSKVYASRIQAVKKNISAVKALLNNISKLRAVFNI